MSLEAGFQDKKFREVERVLARIWKKMSTYFNKLCFNKGNFTNIDVTGNIFIENISNAGKMKQASVL